MPCPETILWINPFVKGSSPASDEVSEFGSGCSLLDETLDETTAPPDSLIIIS